MSRQNTQSDSNLKRQLTFLKTIDQKLEGLRRENERLLRLADNPRVAFSRSSLAGTYRIINSLVSAGPMYGLTDIENWAKENRDWLVSLGKRGADPAPEEMERLQKSIGELSRLRDEAVAEAEKNSKNTENSSADKPEKEEEILSFEPEPIAEEALRDSAINAKETTDTAGAASKSTENGAAPDTGFPFSDEPKAKSIKDSAFAPKPRPVPKKKPGKNERPKHHRDRTSTIPLAIDDLAMLGTTSKIPPGISKSKLGPGFWKIFAIASFIGFVLMTVLYIKEASRPTLMPTTTAASPPSQPAEPVKEPPTVAEEQTPSTAVRGETDKPAQAAVASASESETAASQVKTEAAPSAPPEEKVSSTKTSKDKKKDKKKEKSKSSASSGSSASSASSKSTAGEPKGILYVKAPEDGTPVFVLVDGTSRGKAPVKTALSPGLHEVVFTANGKRSMRMVPIKADNTKTIVAVKPN